MTFYFLNNVANGAESIYNYIKIASLKTKTMGTLINRITGSCLLIPGFPDSALRTHFESLGKPLDVNKRSQSLA